MFKRLFFIISNVWYFNLSPPSLRHVWKNTHIQTHTHKKKKKRKKKKERKTRTRLRIDVSPSHYVNISVLTVLIKVMFTCDNEKMGTYV